MLAPSVNRFGTDLWGHARSQEGNLVVSPASIWVALAMAHAGARGATAAELAAVMHLPSRSDVDELVGRQVRKWNGAHADYTLHVVQRLFGESSYRFEDAYLRLTARTYAAPLETVDFRNACEPARQHINAWVADATRDRIRDLLPGGSITDQTRLVLANAVYFLGRWMEPFERFRTRDEAFFVGGTTGVNVPTMRRQATMQYAETDDAQLVQLGYRGGDLAMLLVVPRARTGLPALERALDAAALDRWASALKGGRLVDLALPKLTVDPPGSLRLAEILRAMGMPAAFDRDHADFTGMADPPPPEDRLCIGEVFHKAFVRVDEAGTEAAAATAMDMIAGGPPRPAEPIELRVDRPFLFVLREVRTGLVLFLGRVDDPRGHTP